MVLIVHNEGKKVNFVKIFTPFGIPYGQKPLKTSKNGQNWPYPSSQFCVSALLFAYSPLHFSNLFHEIFRINVRLNLYLILLSEFLILVSRKFWRPNSKIFRENFGVPNFYGSSGDYYLSNGFEKSKSWCIGGHAYFLFFGPLLAGKLAWPPRAPLMVWGFQTRPKSWPTGWIFWDNHYLEF